MHKRIAKVVTASLMAAAMLTTTVATVVPMSVSAGLCVGETEFNKKGLPWHTCETSPAKQTFKIENGGYTVTIENPGGSSRGGESRWDLQFRHRKLKIQKGHTYKIHWEVTASTAGEMATHIATLDGESTVVWHNNCGMGTGGNEWNNVQINAGKNVFDSEFTANESIDVAEWAFHYGGSGEYQPQDCFPIGTTLTFDNMSLECTTCPDGYAEGTCNWDPSDNFGVTSRDNSGLENNFISVNQVGYFTNLDKKATLGDNAGADEDDTKITLPDTALDFELVNENGETVYTGKTTPKGKDEDSGDNVHILDFSDYNTPGTYSLKCGDYVSFPFEIGDNIYSVEGHDMLTNAMNYYYQNRSGINIETAYITSRDDEKSSLAHVMGHNPDSAWVQSKWEKSYDGVFANDPDADMTYKIDGTGGWYDAGDHGKYVVNGGISVWTLQNIYERAVAEGNSEKFANGSGTIVVPETNNDVPDILDETKVELDWMMKMVVSSSDPYWGKYEGLVYHKLHDHKWTGLAVRPNDYEDTWGTTRIVKPPSFAATLNFVACAAQAARLWEDIDPAYAKTCLDAAKKSYEAYKKNFYEYTPAEATNKTSLYAPFDQAIGGGAYGDTNVKDDAYWAACELYATTGDSTYYDDIKGYSEAFQVVKSLEGGENNGSYGSFNWGNTASLGSLTLLLNNDGISADELGEIKSSLTAAADDYIKTEDEQGYGIPYKSATFEDPVNIGPDIKITGYEWGSNSFVINNAIIMAYAYDTTEDTKYLNGVVTAMDYILGRNPLSFSYVTGYGSYHLIRPHHRYWSNELDPTFPEAPDGIMSGGPGSGMQDPYIGGLGYERGTLAPQRCYVDSIEAWSVNEVTINWNAPFAWVVSFLQDEANVTSDGLVVNPKNVTVEVGAEDTIEATVNGEHVDADFKSNDESIATVNNDGTVTGVSEGTTTITVTYGDKTATVNVTVKPVSTDDPTSGTDETVSTDEIPADTHWGDVNVDSYVNIADVVALNMYLIGKEANPVTKQGLINANVVYDDYINTNDSLTLMNYIAMVIAYEKLGPQ